MNIFGPNSPLAIEEARSAQSGQIIGYRLNTVPPTKTVLVFVDQESMPGFRLGQEFIAALDDTINYTWVHDAPQS